MPTGTKKARGVTPVDVAHGEARVFVHRTIGSVFIDGQKFNRPADVEGRTWSFTCPAATARSLIERYEFAAGSEGAVPLTVDEKREAEDLKARSNVEVGRMAQALAEVARQKVAKDAGGE